MGLLVLCALAMGAGILLLVGFLGMAQEWSMSKAQSR